MTMSSEQASLRGRIGNHVRWSQNGNGLEATAKARRTFLESFERQVDPEGVLEPAERARRAAHAHKAHMARLALKSAAARKAKANPPPKPRRRRATPAREVGPASD